MSFSNSLKIDDIVRRRENNGSPDPESSGKIVDIECDDFSGRGFYTEIFVVERFSDNFHYREDIFGLEKIGPT